MSRRILALLHELHSTKLEMEIAEQQPSQSEEQKRSVRLELERRLKQTESQLAEVRRSRRHRDKEVAYKSMRQIVLATELGGAEMGGSPLETKNVYEPAAALNHTELRLCVEGSHIGRIEGIP